MLPDPAPRPRLAIAREPLATGLEAGRRGSANRHPSLASWGGLDRAAVASALRARLERDGSAPAGTSISLCPEIDGALPGRGLPRAALHEILSDGTGAAQGFAAFLMARAEGSVFWIATAPDAPPPGLTRFGLAPSRLVLLRPADAASALWAAEEALRCPAVSAVLLSGVVAGAEALHRLQLAAGTGGGIGLLLRDDEEEVAPSPAATQWRVTGRAGGAAGNLGDPQWTLELLRCRAGKPLRWDVTWRAGMDSLVPDEEAGDEEVGDEEHQNEERAGARGRARRR